MEIILESIEKEKMAQGTSADSSFYSSGSYKIVEVVSH